MKKIIVLVLAVIGGYLIYNHANIHKVVSDKPQSSINISEIKSHTSVYADSLLTLKNLHVVETQSLLNYSRSKVADVSGTEIILLSKRPYCMKEAIGAIKGRYTILYINNKDQYGAFISEDLKPFNDFLKTVKESIIPDVKSF